VLLAHCKELALDVLELLGNTLEFLIALMVHRDALQLLHYLLQYDQKVLRLGLPRAGCLLAAVQDQIHHLLFRAGPVLRGFRMLVLPRHCTF
jgi:hypothetical protein